MQIKNKLLIMVLLAVFSFFTPLISIIFHILGRVIGTLTKNKVSISWDIITMIDMILMAWITFILMMFLRKIFNNKDIKHGISGFATVNFLCGLAVYKNPISLFATFYQAVNFLSNIILSKFVYILEEGKPYMLLLPIFTFLLHIILNYIATILESRSSTLSN